MACASCGTPGGCQNNGNCSTGGCNRLNAYDWLTDINSPVSADYGLIEVSFKNGSRKAFYRKPNFVHCITGDWVAVEASTGYDVGTVTLSGELVKLQMRKKQIDEDTLLPSALRIANERDMERLKEARDKEWQVMIRARAIAASLKLEMKIGDVEFQGDKRKATFYYTADGRVDFRELIKSFAKEFRIRIEMRQIGARQESARIGGLGSCGRELCCSTWLTDFQSVSTTAARYQNLAINQSKLSGQCGRLKCCLNYELDTYLEALKDFPSNSPRLETEAGTADLVKTDIFKRIMYYNYRGAMMSKTYALPLKRVWEIIELNKKGKKPEELMSNKSYLDSQVEEEVGFVDVTGQIELKSLDKKGRGRGRRKTFGKNSADSNKGGNNKSKNTKSQSRTNKPKNKKTENKADSQNKSNQQNDNKGGQKNSVKRSNKNRNSKTGQNRTQNKNQNKDGQNKGNQNRGNENKGQNKGGQNKGQNKTDRNKGQKTQNKDQKNDPNKKD